MCAEVACDQSAAASCPIFGPHGSSQSVQRCVRGFGKCRDPSGADTVAATLGWFLDNRSQHEWNYDMAFAGVFEELNEV